MNGKKPPWLQVSYNQCEVETIKRLTEQLKLNTVCCEAACPNLGECYKNHSATFMILGRQCTRNCRFCNVISGKAELPDRREPKHLAEAVIRMKLNHVVITSVTRDDLPDGGAAHFAACIEEIKQQSPHVTIEVLIPDFQGQEKDIQTIIDAAPEVIGHNVETAMRLYPEIRPEADYARSMNVLFYIKRKNPRILVKTGIMAGLGETQTEVIQIMNDAKKSGCDIFTIGQYLRPSPSHAEVKEYITPEQFLIYKAAGEKIGFRYIASGPLVRSSYHAEEALKAGG